LPQILIVRSEKLSFSVSLEWETEMSNISLTVPFFFFTPERERKSWTPTRESAAFLMAATSYSAKLTLQYDGTRYLGWTRPAADGYAKTISYRISSVLQKMTGEDITLFAGAKTAPGVSGIFAV